MSDDDDIIPLRPEARLPPDTELGTCYVSIESGPDAGKRFGPLDELTTIGQPGRADIGLDDFLRPFFRRLFRRTHGDVDRAAVITQLPRAFVGLMKERFWDAT